jgi:hypothetical protein
LHNKTADLELQARSADIVTVPPSSFDGGEKENIETDFTAREDRGSGA